MIQAGYAPGNQRASNESTSACYKDFHGIILASDRTALSVI